MKYFSVICCSGLANFLFSSFTFEQCSPGGNQTSSIPSWMIPFQSFGCTPDGFLPFLLYPFQNLLICRNAGDAASPLPNCGLLGNMELQHMSTSMLLRQNYFAYLPHLPLLHPPAESLSWHSPMTHYRECTFPSVWKPPNWWYTSSTHY